MANNQNDKSALLQQLKIHPSDKQEASGLKVWHLLVAMLLSAGLTYWLTLTLSGPVQAGQDNVQARKNAPRPAEEKAAEPKPAVRATDNQSILNSSGYITARRTATVSAEIMGLITQVNVEEGMQVTEGQVLAQLDNALASVSLELAHAQVKALIARKNAMQADLEEARRNNQRISSNDYSSEAERTRAMSQLQSLTASLESAEADILVARLEARRQQERLDDHTIRAPFGGVVTEKNAQPGEIVAPTSAGGGFTRTGICTIVDMESLEIEVDVNEAFIGRVFPGQKVDAHLDAYPDWTIPASVIAIIPTADRAKATVQVRIKLEESDPRILPDMGVKVAFQKT
ncbi:efflux RND transporter periplasmic adaptor subunit [Bowmanella dokdonensis]|uniref:Efflux RND transporter periplasmic adaptor subunit n=1 Tax=Bowmanella dokdonensis TaxID=751969 RepID=A0A939IR81_9ALTE|nr:efflux RND transporter periplasmic adaptor subunit [Bowmanella dokdonensis]MBN7825226.1 efflux RND transporter periplasmic adaptor subunit [Bowmanella dokdonensis]